MLTGTGGLLLRFCPLNTCRRTNPPRPLLLFSGCCGLSGTVPLSASLSSTSPAFLLDKGLGLGLVYTHKLVSAHYTAVEKQTLHLHVSGASDTAPRLASLSSTLPVVLPKRGLGLGLVETHEFVSAPLPWESGYYTYLSLVLPAQGPFPLPPPPLPRRP